MPSPTPMPILTASASKLLGYLNFSDGRPDPRWQALFNDVAHEVGDVTRLRHALHTELQTLAQSGSGAFRDVSQAQAVLDFALDLVPTAYRNHHADLLANLSDELLYAPLFLVRVCEAVLAQGSPWTDRERIVRGALDKLNDFVGHRPVPVLETRSQIELYPHEKIRPVPLYLRGVGVGHGRYHSLISRAIEVLKDTPADLQRAAHFDLDLLDELAVDPRAYDHAHPVNRRPNYLFGEWDPHLIDAQGYYRRMVLRQATLDAMLERASDADKLAETGTVLAGTILMASGVSGWGPSAHDSSMTLGQLVPQVARYRDAFYEHALKQATGAYGDKLRKEAEQLRQPFGGARQYLNAALARQRATQLQERRLVLVFAEMGYPEASRQRAARIAAASVRLLGEIRLCQTEAQQAAEEGNVARSLTCLSQAETLLHRGINCGALVDPWNILGFQGLFPLFASREDSVRDPRVEELLDVMSRQFAAYARSLAAAAVAGEESIRAQLTRGMQRLAEWWDRFATHEVSDLPRVNGQERAIAAEHVALALSRWQTRASATGPAPTRAVRADSDVAFWRSHRDGFRSPAAYGQVVEALLRDGDHRASLALLMAWLSEAESVMLEDASASFHSLIERWLRSFLSRSDAGELLPELTRFFEKLEANADTLWDVPSLIPTTARPKEEDPYGSAYEGMTYVDSTDDGNEGALLSDEPRDVFALEDSANEIENRLKFLAMLAKLWQLAGDQLAASTDRSQVVSQWLEVAMTFDRKLREFLDTLHSYPVPEPIGQVDAVVEYDRRRGLKDSLIDQAINTAVEFRRAIWALGSAGAMPESALADYEPATLGLMRSIGRSDSAALRRQLPGFLKVFMNEPMLFVPLSDGGNPQQILRARLAQALTQLFLERLACRGLLRETYHLLKTARSMEQNAPSEGRKITEFDRLLRLALQSVIESIVDSAATWSPNIVSPQQFAELLRTVANSFLSLWITHSQTLRLSILESLNGPADWAAMREFIRKYGGDLFTPAFLTVGNLRGLLHRGVSAYLTSLLESGESAKPIKLIDDLRAGRLARERAVSLLECVLQAILENYEEYRDFNTTTTHSDYGENLHLLLDFLSLKAKYERYAWRMRPLMLVHEVLCRKGHFEIASRWQTMMADFTSNLADGLMNDLANLERDKGIRLRTIRDRIEERFVQMLTSDRLCALAEPAIREAPRGGPMFQRFSRDLETLAATPTGVGLDVPAWLRRLESELTRWRERQSLPEGMVRLGPAPTLLTYSELQQQLADWEQPL